MGKSTELKIYGYYYHNTRHVCVSKNFSKLFRSILRAKRAKYRRKGFDKFLCCVSVSVLFRRKIHIDCLCDCTPPPRNHACCQARLQYCSVRCVEELCYDWSVCIVWPCYCVVIGRRESCGSWYCIVIGQYVSCGIKSTHNIIIHIISTYL